MLKTDLLELYVDCPQERMDELIGLMRKLAKRPWMYWDTRYNGSFSPPDPSFDFARFQIDDPQAFLKSQERTAKYLGQIRWMKQPAFNVLLAWETYTDGQRVSQAENDFLIQDFHDLIIAPACEQLNLDAYIGPSIWQSRKK